MRRHGGQPRQAGAACKRQQYGFDLVVGVLCDDYGFDSCSRWTGERQDIKSLIAVAARGVFRALAGRGARIDAAHMQRHAQALTQRHAMLLKVVGCRLQPVVHVPGFDAPRPARRAGQQQRC